jgi:hypothetical protein
MRFVSPRLTFTSALMLFVGAAAPWQATAACPVSTSAIMQEGEATPSVTGNWQMSWTDKDGNAKQGSMQIQQSDGKLGGTFKAPRASVALHGTIDANHISIVLKSPFKTITFTGTVDGNKMSGTLDSGAPWSATRQ